MSSLVSGYEYDIFISYRHNDNRSGGVTEFVEHLKAELAATIKEPISIYFDSNPHDGLLENHHVDKSLERKLKCLIFIPIISQTYCDPKSFAWQHEFCAFNKFAQTDQLGRDIKLYNGNVASRILPIKIHELDAEDSATIENEIGGVLRAIEFIHKSSGVNRPLTSLDDQVRESGKILYRDQINKVANAVKEIIVSINPSNNSLALRLENKIANPSKSTVKLGAVIASIVFVLVVALYFLYPKFVTEAPPVDYDKSIAVLPFVNMSKDPDQEYFSDGLSEELLNLLSKIPELKVIARTSSFSFKGKNTDVRIIGQQLGVAYLLEGSVRKSGNNLRITAQLIQTHDGTHIWSDTYDKELKDVFGIQDEIAIEITTQLRLKIPGLDKKVKSRNIEAYDLMLEANYIERLEGSNEKVIELMEKAVSLDSADATLWAQLAKSYGIWEGTFDIRTERYEKARKYADKAIALDPNNPVTHRTLASILKTFYWDWKGAQHELDVANTLESEENNVIEDPGSTGLSYDINATYGNWDEAIAASKRGRELDPINPWSWRGIGFIYLIAGRPADAIAPLKKALELNRFFQAGWMELGWAYSDNKEYTKALEAYDQAPDQEHDRLYFLRCQTYYAMGNIAQSDLYLNKLLQNDNSTDNSAFLARIYAQRGLADKSYEWLEKAYERRSPVLSLFIGLFREVKALNDPRYDEFLKKMNLPTD